MNEKIRHLEQKMNDYIVKIGAKNNFIYAYLPLFHDLVKELIENLDPYSKKRFCEIEYDKITKVPLFKQIEYIKKFYQEMKIPFDIDSYMNDGTIQFEYYDYFYDNEEVLKQKRRQFAYGFNRYENGHKSVSICNNGFVTDILVAIHEISHLRNQPEQKRNIYSALLTETLAYTDVLIVADDLSKKGYEKDMRIYLQNMYIEHYKDALYIESVYKMFLVYETLGSISLENYQYYFKTTKNYLWDFENVNKASKGYFQSFIPMAWYILAMLLSPYLYQKYKEDPSFIKKILYLHKAINQFHVCDCFEIMGLIDFENDRKELDKSMRLVMEKVFSKNITHK